MELWSVDNIRFLAGGAACVVTAKSHQAFSYKGTPNDDVATSTVVLEKQGDAWKVVQWQRSTGVPPEKAANPKTA